jgi:hypothetical protein
MGCCPDDAGRRSPDVRGLLFSQDLNPRRELMRYTQRCLCGKTRTYPNKESVPPIPSCRRCGKQGHGKIFIVTRNRHPNDLRGKFGTMVQVRVAEGIQAKARRAQEEADRLKKEQEEATARAMRQQRSGYW